MPEPRQSRVVDLAEPAGTKILGPSGPGDIWSLNPEDALRKVLVARLTPDKTAAQVLHELICRGLECERLHKS